MQRRNLLKLGLGSALLLGVAGGVLTLFRPGLIRGRLTDEASQVFRAVARGVLQGSLPSPGAERDLALQAFLTRLGKTLAGFPLATQRELSQLLAILASTSGRSLLATLDKAWAKASEDEIQQALQRMRTSSLALRQQAYHALRDLTNAAFYADASAWPLLGYPGPVVV